MTKLSYEVPKGIQLKRKNKSFTTLFFWLTMIVKVSSELASMASLILMILLFCCCLTYIASSCMALL